MIIRATKKLLNTSGIKPVANLQDPDQALPGEWYATLVPTGRPGKLVIHFFHNPTKISILMPGKSLNKVLPDFPNMVKDLLKRMGYYKLVFQFQLSSSPQIYTTNSRSMLAHLNQLKYALEYKFYSADSLEDINFREIEDYLSKYLFTSKGREKFEKPVEILKNLHDGS